MPAVTVACRCEEEGSRRAAMQRSREAPRRRGTTDDSAGDLVRDAPHARHNDKNKKKLRERSGTERKGSGGGRRLSLSADGSPPCAGGRLRQSRAAGNHPPHQAPAASRWVGTERPTRGPGAAAADDREGTVRGAATADPIGQPRQPALHPRASHEYCRVHRRPAGAASGTGSGARAGG